MNKENTGTKTIISSWSYLWCNKKVEMSISKIIGDLKNGGVIFHGKRISSFLIEIFTNNS